MFDHFMFTNDLLPETIEITSNYLYDENKDIIRIYELKRILKIMFIGTQEIFMINGKL